MAKEIIILELRFTFRDKCIYAKQESNLYGAIWEKCSGGALLEGGLF